MFIQENAFETVVCKLSAILSGSQCVNGWRFGSPTCVGDWALLPLGDYIDRVRYLMVSIKTIHHMLMAHVPPTTHWSGDY